MYVWISLYHHQLLFLSPTLPIWNQKFETYLTEMVSFADWHSLTNLVLT